MSENLLAILTWFKVKRMIWQPHVVLLPSLFPVSNSIINTETHFRQKESGCFSFQPQLVSLIGTAESKMAAQ